VADIPEAAAELVNAYNRLQSTLAEANARVPVQELRLLADNLRMVAGRPVPLGDGSGMQISPYEIGIATEAAPTARLAVNTQKLRHALSERAGAVRVLFTDEEKGLLSGLLAFSIQFKNVSHNDATAMYWETVYPALIRFINECRRIHMFWLE
jgi:flagellar capping protein FliD